MPNNNEQNVPEQVPGGADAPAVLADRWWRNVNFADAAGGWERRPQAIRFRDHFNPFGDKLPQEGKRGEELFQLILSGIREIYNVEGTIAGGAVRDLAAGVEHPKDVDVFVQIDMDTFWKHADELGWQGPNTTVSKGVYDKDKCAVPSVGRISSRVQNVMVDLILMSEPLTPLIVSKFPVHAQRGVWTLNEGKVLSPEAQTDIIEKKFTIDPTITDKNKIKTVVDKIKGWQKRPEYKDWTVVEPDVKEWWEEKEKLAAAQAKVEEEFKQRIKAYTTKDTKYADFWNEGVEIAT